MGAGPAEDQRTNRLGGSRRCQGNRPLFAFASYNCGPGNVSKARKEVTKRGLDPDKWFNDVEVVVAEKIGTETTACVRNIYKFYVSYRLTLDAQDLARQAREQVAPCNRRLLGGERQSTGTVRYLATSAALTAVPRLPHDWRMYVTTSATSWSVSE